MATTPIQSGFYLGLDLGSVSVNTVILDPENKILEEYYDYVHGKPFEVLKDRLISILEKYPPEKILELPSRDPEAS